MTLFLEAAAVVWLVLQVLTLAEAAKGARDSGRDLAALDHAGLHNGKRFVARSAQRLQRLRAVVAGQYAAAGLIGALRVADVFGDGAALVAQTLLFLGASACQAFAAYQANADRQRLISHPRDVLGDS